jgi:hypothetical protein
MSDESVLNPANDIFYGWRDWESGERDPNRILIGDNALFRDRIGRTDMKDAPRVRRGYMRSADTAKYGPGRLFFQYNPEALQRSNYANEDVYLPSQLTAAELSVPNTITTDFSFNLLFDRRAEVASGMFNDPSREPGLDPDYKTEKRLGGVLQDVYVFDRIAGLGYGGLGDGTITEGMKLTDTPYGNQAVKYTTPVRVIFSSTMMVEGFVQAAEVTYSMFNANMLPVMCTIKIGMKAYYIGWARKSTGIMAFTDREAQEYRDTLGLGPNTGDPPPPISSGGRTYQ